MKEGYIKLHRQIRDSDIYVMPPLYLRTFERLIIEANHKCNRIPFKDKGIWTDKLVKRGERITSIRDISEWVGWYERGKFKAPNPKTMKQVLDYLVQSNMIKLLGNDKGNKRYTHYHIVNYHIYQGNDNIKATTKVTEKKQSVPINKNEKNSLVLSTRDQEERKIFPGFYDWIEENNYVECKYPNEEPYYLKWLHERASHSARTKGKRNIETQNFIKQFEERKKEADNETIIKAQNII